MKAKNTLSRIVALSLFLASASATAETSECESELVPSGPNPTGVVCEETRPDGLSNVWRMTLPTPIAPATTSERRLDIDVIVVDSAQHSGPVSGGTDVELLHVVFTSGTSETRLPVRLRRQGTPSVPTSIYEGWVDAQAGRTYTIPEMVDRANRVLPLSLKLSCNYNTSRCSLLLLDWGFNPAIYLEMATLTRPADSTVAIEFGMKAGYSNAIPNRVRFFKPFNN